MHCDLISRLSVWILWYVFIPIQGRGTTGLNRKQTNDVLADEPGPAEQMLKSIKLPEKRPAILLMPQ